MNTTRRRLTAFAVALLPFVSVAFSQMPDGPKFKTLLCEEQSGCVLQYHNGQVYKMLSDGDLYMLVSMGAYDKYIWADVTVFNGRAAPVDVLPTNFGLEEREPKQKTLEYVDADQALRSKLRRMAWSNAFTAMGGSMARQQTMTTTNNTGTISGTSPDGTYTRDSYTGTSTATTSTPDYAARARANEVIRVRSEAMASLSQKVENDALKANTIMPNGYVHGFVLFARDKKAKRMLLSLRVGDTAYQFPFAFVKK